MIETTNRARAQWARAAVDEFTRRTYGGRTLAELPEEDQLTAVQDLLTDLMHLVDRLPAGDLLRARTGDGAASGLEELETLMHLAANHYEAEILEDPAGD